VASELNFCTPVTVSAWYSRWERELPEELLEGAFWRWQKRFPSLKRLLPLEGMGNPLWFVIGALNDGNSHTPDWLSSLETHFSQNRLRLITQDEMMKKSP